MMSLKLRPERVPPPSRATTRVWLQDRSVLDRKRKQEIRLPLAWQHPSLAPILLSPNQHSPAFPHCLNSVVPLQRSLTCLFSVPEASFQDLEILQVCFIASKGNRPGKTNMAHKLTVNTPQEDCLLLSPPRRGCRGRRLSEILQKCLPFFGSLFPHS